MAGGQAAAGRGLLRGGEGQLQLSQTTCNYTKLA